MVIVGAGIGGPALGIALKRAGIESIVYEASDEPRDDAGAFLNLAPNGLAVLQALGLGRRLDGLGFQNDRLVFHNETGRTLAEVAVGGVTVMRGAVSRVLREAAEEAGVRFEFGKTLSSLTEHNGDVIARFADG
ncbi:MAG TPA: FAD-dependent monooxygenase, partial [Vicinamibacterales bacterium]